MLYRKAYDKLLEWKKQKKRTALCIQGARQIGKTTVVREFGKNEYKCFVEFNFIRNTNVQKVFDGKPRTLSISYVHQLALGQRGRWKHTLQ